MAESEYVPRSVGFGTIVPPKVLGFQPLSLPLLLLSSSFPLLFLLLCGFLLAFVPRSSTAMLQRFLPPCLTESIFHIKYHSIFKKLKIERDKFHIKYQLSNKYCNGIEIVLDLLF